MSNKITTLRITKSTKARYEKELRVRESMDQLLNRLLDELEERRTK